MLGFNLEDLLDDRYDIDINDYWSLTEDDKDRITEIVVTNVLVQLSLAPDYYPRYIELLNDSIKVAGEFEQYEKAEMLNRMKKRFLEIKSI
jgi:hypothetical protein